MEKDVEFAKVLTVECVLPIDVWSYRVLTSTQKKEGGNFFKKSVHIKENLAKS